MRDDVLDEQCVSPKAAKGGESTFPGPEGIRVMKTKRSGEEMRELVMDTRGGREARKELLKLKATVGEARMMGIVDSGAMASMISAERLEASGLPSKPLGDRSFKVTGMDGGVGYCRAWVEAAKIYVTPSGLETTSDLYVLENADFDLLLGRPWMTFNEVNIMERQRGTYVSWMSGDTRYEINASKARRAKLPRVVKRQEAREGNTEESDNEGDRIQTVAAYAVRSTIDHGTDRSYIPWSIETQEGPDYLEEDKGSKEDEETEETVRRKAQAKVETWSKRKREEEEEADDEREEGERDTDDQWDADDEPEGGKVREQKFPVGRPSTKREKTTYSPPGRAEAEGEEESEGIIVVDRNLEEDFASLVQEEANEHDWERFCIKERKRLARRQKVWLDWIDSDNDELTPARTFSQKDEDREDQAPDEREGPEELSPPQEPTPVLESPPPKKTNRVSSKEDEEQAVTTEIEARRSQRVRRRTVKGQYADKKGAWREYRREERALKTVSKHKRQKMREDTLDEPFGGPRLRSFCIIVHDDPQQDEEDRLREEEWVSGPRNDHQLGEASHQATHLNQSQDRSYENTIEDLPEGLQPYTEDLARGSHDLQATYKQLPLADIGNPEEPCTKQRKGFAEPENEWVENRRGDEIDGLSIIEPISNLIYEYATEEPTARARDRYLRPRPDSENILYMGPMAGVIGRRPDVDGTQGWRGRGPQEGMESWDGGIERVPRTSWMAKSELPIRVSTWEETPRPMEKQLTDHADARTIIRAPELRNTRETTDEEEVRGTIDLSEPNTHALPTRQNELSGDAGNDSPRVRSRGKAGEERKLNERNEKSNGCEGRTRESIKEQGRKPRNPHLPSWLWKRWTRAPSDKLFRTVANCSLLLSIGLLLTAALLQLYHLQTRPQGMMLTNGGVPFSADSARRSGVYDPAEVNLDDWTYNPAYPLEEDIPKAVLDTIEVPGDKSLTPAIIAVRHMVPLAAGSSPGAREYLGKAIMVSFRLPSGRVAHQQGDMHLRLFERERNSDWTGTPFPIRYKVDLLRGMLFNEEGLGELLDYLIEDGGALLEKLMNEVEGRKHVSSSEDGEAKEWEEAELESTKRRQEPVKVGPPTLKRPGGFVCLNREPGNSLTAVLSGRQEPVSHDWMKVKEEVYQEGEETRYRRATMIAKIKVEEDDEKPYRMGLLHRPGYGEGVLETDDDDDMSFLSELEERAGVTPPNTLDEPSNGEGVPAAPRVRSVELPGLGFKITGFDESEDEDDIPLLEVIPPDLSSEGSSRTSDEILSEIVDTLKKLRLEFASAIDVETRWMVQDLELGAEKLQKLKEAGVAKAGSEDEVMGKPNEEKDPVPEYQPQETMAVDPHQGDPVEALDQKIDAVGRDLRDLEWRMEGDDSRAERKWRMAEAKIVALEVRMKEFAKELARTGQMEASPSRKKSSRDLGEYHGLRGRVQKVENRVQAAAKEINGVRARVVDVERAIKEIGEIRRKVNGLDVLLGSVHGEVMVWGRRVVTVEVKIEEGRLRQEHFSRELAANWAIIHTCLPRVGRLEAKLTEVDYRLTTAEEQNVWLDQKVRAVWLAAMATDLVEKTAYCNGVRATWDMASAAFARRFEKTPYVATEPRHPETGLLLASTTTPHAALKAVGQPSAAK